MSDGPDPLSVACPKYIADAGEYCVTISTRLPMQGAHFHVPRVDLARRRAAFPADAAVLLCRRATGVLQIPQQSRAAAFDAAWEVCDRKCAGDHTVAYDGGGGRIKVRSITIKTPRQPQPKDER